MLINEGATIDNATCSDSSLIDNGFNELNRTGYRELDPNISYGYAEAESSENPTLIINGGTFIGGRHTLKNDVNGVATIKGGSFSSSTGNAVYNVGELTISGGEFTANAEGKFALHSAAESGKTYGPESAAGNTTVTGGTFFGKLQKDDDASMAISGGEFSEVVPENYCAEWYVPVTTKNDHEMYTVSLASATVITPPTAKENLKYNGTEQTLVNEGTVTGGTLEYGFAEPAEVIGKGGQYVLSGDDLTVGKIFKPSDFDGFIFPTGKSVKLLNNNDVFSPYNGSDQSLYDHVNVFLNGITPTICSDDNTYTEFPNGCDALRIDKINGDTIEITAVKSSECFEVKTWSATPPKGIDAGEYNVYYRVKGDDNHNDIAPTKIENVKIAKADPTVTTAPQAKTLTYNGELQELITAGTSEDGTVQYAVVETDGDTPEYTVVKLDSYTSLYPSDAEVNTVYTPDLEGENKGNAGVSFSGGAYIIDDITYTGIRLRYNPGNSKYYLTTNKGTLNLAEGIDGLLITDIDSDSGNVYIELVNTANPAGEVEIDEEAWVESIPKETDAGEYNVYYRVKGDANHNDSKPTKIDGVKIAEAEITGVTLTPRAPKAILKSGKTRVNVGFSAEPGEGFEIEEFGLLYGNTGTKDVSEFTIENVNGESICKLENNYGANVLDKGNGVVAVGYVKVNGVYIYTDNLGASYADLIAKYATLTPRDPKAILKSGKTRVNVGFSAEPGEGFEIEEFGLLYGNTGTKDVSEFTIENVNGESICKLENNYGANVLDKGNGVVAVGYVKVNGVYIYTDNLGASYADLIAKYATLTPRDPKAILKSGKTRVNVGFSAEPGEGFEIEEFGLLYGNTGTKDVSEFTIENVNGESICKLENNYGANVLDKGNGVVAVGYVKVNGVYIYTDNLGASYADLIAKYATLTPRDPKAILKSGKTRVNVGFSAEPGEGFEIEEFGLLYGNTGTKDVSEFTIENVNGESICKLENNYGANVLDKGNGVVARGYVKVNGVYIYTDNLGGSYAELTAQV